MNTWSQVRNQILDPELEEKYWQEYWTGKDSIKAYKNLVEYYLPLVARIVERLSIRVHQQLEKEELLSLGVVGLHHTVKSCSHERGGAFATYAKKRIRGSILDELRRQDHLSRNQRQEYRHLCQTIRELTEEHGRPPTDIQIEEATGLNPGQMQLLIEMAGKAVSLNERLGEGMTFMDTIADAKSQSPSDAADEIFAKEAMRDAFKYLETREQQLLYLRHNEGMRVKEIAEIMGISEGRISQIYKGIIIKLRAVLNVDAKS